MAVPELCTLGRASVMQSPNPSTNAPHNTDSEEKPRAIKLFLLLFVRYVVAIAVAWVSSFATFFLWLLVFRLVSVSGVIVFYGAFILVGFAGVFFGTLCLPSGNRRFGSILLLLAGLAYYDGSFGFIVHGISETRCADILLLTAGGLGAIAFFFLRRRPNKTLQSTAAASASRD